ncbi:MAG: AmpG family muropeptide MFS transporter [Gammaproteobacteria bacterium]|nr:AmpG family muropeptide MFS transporter [Gammaproteobacteria bacterium]
MSSWAQSFQIYLRPKMLAMLLLGFSAGLPLLLVFGTLSFWLRKEGIDRSTIGYISWVAAIYGLKFLWSPLVDRLSIPFLSKSLGQRRGWMLVAQIGVLSGLILLGTVNPQEQLSLLIMFALLVAFSSATQDIALDAWRIESAPDYEQGAMAGTYQLGYRLGMLLAGGGAFSLAHFYNWSFAYSLMGASMLIGIITTLVISEPKRLTSKDIASHEKAVVDFMARPNALPSFIQNFIAWFIGAVICPFADFFKRNGVFAIVILLFIGTFRLSDITMGVMAGPFYADMGYSELQVGLVSKTFGVVVTILGALLGGVLVMRWGILKVLIIAGILVIVTNLVFAWLATQEPKTVLLVIVITADNLSGGIAGTVFIAYLSSLTNKVYTATQYALLSSVMLLPAKFIGGFSGEIVDKLGYINFFLYAGGLGIPAIIIAVYLGTRKNISNLSFDNPQIQDSK